MRDDKLKHVIGAHETNWILFLRYAGGKFRTLRRVSYGNEIVTDKASIGVGMVIRILLEVSRKGFNTVF